MDADAIDSTEQTLFNTPIPPGPRLIYLSHDALGELEKLSGQPIDQDSLRAIVDDDGGFLCWAIHN